MPRVSDDVARFVTDALKDRETRFARRLNDVINERVAILVDKLRREYVASFRELAQEALLAELLLSRKHSESPETSNCSPKT